MGDALVAGARVATRFAVPSGPAPAVLETLDEAGLGLARARIAARMGNPDPFHLRAALVGADGAVGGTTGDAVSADAADAVLLAADAARPTPDPALAGLFAGRPPGPKARAVPVDDPARTWLRWQSRPTRPASVREVRSWSTLEIGDVEVATVRCVEPIPGGVALGSDYGLTLEKGGTFTPFPWPKGSRREARRVEAMAVHQRHLHIATSQTLYVWDFAARVTSRRHGPDLEDGFDDLNALLAANGRIYAGYRSRFEGGDGPLDALSLAADSAGVVYAGTRSGEIHVVDGGGPIRKFADHKPRPVRHLAFAEGALWVSALGALHRFDGASWTTQTPEPTALAVDPEGRLWALAEGRLFVLVDGALERVEVALERPWSLAAVPGAIWIGGRERVWRVGIG